MVIRISRIYVLLHWVELMMQHIPINQHFIKAWYAHVLIENTFKSLKNRWRILKNLNVDVKHVALVITASCVLHNFCHMNHDICCSGIAGMQNPHINP
jgi:hypothetical protein